MAITFTTPDQHLDSAQQLISLREELLDIKPTLGYSILPLIPAKQLNIAATVRAYLIAKLAECTSEISIDFVDPAAAVQHIMYTYEELIQIAKLTWLVASPTTLIEAVEYPEGLTLCRYAISDETRQYLRLAGVKPQDLEVTDSSYDQAEKVIERIELCWEVKHNHAEL